MSTTRWIIWCEEHGSANPYRLSSVCESFLRGIHMGDEAPQELTTDCQLVERIVVDPDNLPPVAIQRAAEAVFGVRSGNRWDSVTETTRVGYRKAAEAAVTAFLSDPEPGDQT